MIPVTMIMVMTMDGKIAKDKDHFANWTSKEDKQHFLTITKEYGVIMMGANTFATFPGPLPGRLNVVFSREEDPQPQENVLWVKGDPKGVLERLEDLGYKKALLGGGTFINSLFLENKLIDELLVTVEPKLFGQGLSLFDLDVDINLKLKEVKKLNDDVILLNYKVLYE